MRALLPVVVLFMIVAAPLALAGEQETNLAEVNPRWKRLKAAEKLTLKGDLDAIYRAVLVTAKRGDDADVDVLASLVLREENPLLRLLYGRCLEKIGTEKSVPGLTAKLQGAKPMEQVRVLEVLGFMRDASAIETFFLYAAVKDRQVATEAFRGLARILPKKEVKRLVAAVIDAQTGGATYRGAWAVADVMRSGKSAAGLFRKASRGKTPEAERAKRILSDLTAENVDAAFRYPKTHLVGIETFFTASRPELVVDGDLLAKQNMQKGLDHLKEKAPDYYQFVIRVFRKVDNKRPAHVASPVGWTSRTFSFQRGEAKSWNPELLSYMMVRGASRMLLRDVGDVHTGRRGLSRATVNAYWYCRKHTLVETGRTMGEFIDKLIRQKLWKE
jgi:hypothetical protein